MCELLFFDSNVQELKYRVLKEVVRLASGNELNAKLYDIPRTIVPGPKATMRACLGLNHAMKNRMSIDNYAKQAHKGLSESVSVR